MPRIQGTNNNDTLNGGSGADTILGENGNDSITGGGGGDSIDGGWGNDTIDGGVGNDFITGDDDDDLIFGGDGNDTIIGGENDDTAYGGAGDDLFLTGWNDGDNAFFGGTGTDTIGAMQNSANLGFDGNFDVSNSIEVIDARGFSDFDIYSVGEIAARLDFRNTTLIGVDDIYGEGGNDTLIGSKANDDLWGEGDNDVLAGYLGNDTLRGGSGNDTLIGGAGNDTLIGGTGRDTFIVRDGHDGTVITDFDTAADVLALDLAEADSVQDVLDRAVQVGGDTVITLDNGDTIRLTGVNRANLNATNVSVTASPVCMARGTLVDTLDGPVAIEALRPGARIADIDGHVHRVRAIVTETLRFTAANDPAKPIRIAAHAFGRATPVAPLILSPQHRVAMHDRLARGDVLLPAVKLLGRRGVRRMAGRRTVDYFNILMENHAVIAVQGLWLETLLVTGPGRAALARRIAARTLDELQPMQPARPLCRRDAPCMSALRQSMPHRADVLA